MNEPNDTGRDSEIFPEQTSFDPEHFLLNLASVFFILVFIFIFGQSQTRSNIKNVGIENNVLGTVIQDEKVGLPVRLIIPDINVDAIVEFVGVTSKGSMEVPGSTADVGWFKLGPHPGEVGSAVIAGHVDGKNGGKAVFTNLYKLKVGNKLYIEDDKGITTTFIVRDSRTFDPGYAEEVFSSNDAAHLNLVTCDGVWNGAVKSYSKRLVVFADISN